MTPESESLRSAGGRWAPLLPIVGGLALLAALAFQLREPVHIAGDGALKQYLIESWVETGSMTSRIAWRSPEPWVRETWQEFHEPVAAPFVHDGRVVFPPFFLALSLPLFAVFGFAGLFILPALSGAGLWLAIWGLLSRLGVRGLPAALALAALIFSPLTYFGMMFWEHTPGLLALFGALLVLMRRGADGTGGGLADAGGGFLLAVAVMFRPELLPAAVVILLAGLTGSPRRIWAAAGVAAGVAVWASGNTLATGTPLGLHAQQNLLLSGGDALFKLIRYYSDLGIGMTASAPCAVAGLALGACLLGRRPAETRKLGLTLVLMIAATLAALPFMIPYSGEYMGFRRFELVVIPAGALLAGDLANRYRWAVPLLLVLCVLQGPRMVRQFEVFQWASGPRLSPVIEFIRAERPSVVIGDSQFTEIELSPVMGQTPLAWAAPPDELLALLAEAGRRTDLMRAAVVFWRPGPAPEVTLPIPGREPMRWTRRAGDDEGFAVFTPATESPGS